MRGLLFRLIAVSSPARVRMLYYWLLFFFLAFGSKIVLATAMIYLLLPNDRNCAECDEVTLLVRTNRIGRIGFALSFGFVQWRWCPRCGNEGLARRPPPIREPRLVVPRAQSPTRS